MANTTPQDIGGSDPSIERQIQRQTSTILSTGGVSAPPAVNTGSSLSGQTANLRSVAPVVSGSETVFPQSTAQTSGNAVTITSSVNNDSGDITTVYTSASRINVNPVNQTINQYTSVDSGVSQIVAGDNITVTSTGGNGTGTITISANASAVSYGDSNVVSLLENFGSNTISTTGNISAGNFAGNGAGLTSIQGSSVSGQVSYAAVANSVAAANVSGLGNISTINLDGNASNVLRGDGTFSADANSTYNNSNVVSLLSAFGSNTITTTGLITGNGGGLSNIPYANITGAPVLGNISGINIDGNSSNVLLGNGVFNQLGISSISGVGNIATINLDGNASNVLRGNGSFGPEANGVVGNTLTANLDANGFFISNAANIVANYFVGTATNVEVEAVNNNYSYHIVLTTGSGDTTLHMDADDNFQYDPQDGIMTVTRADTEFLSVTNSVISNLIPFDSLPLNLGSNTNRWNDIYLSNSTIYLGNATISANGNSIVVDSIIVGNNGPVGNIASINLNGNANSVLRGDGTFGADANSTYGDSNVVSLLSAFGSNTISTTGNISAGNIIGNGQALSGINGANVTGEVSYAAVANAVAGANVTGEVSYAVIANSVAVANVSGIGNIATINLDGNTSNVLLGNGVFATIPYPSQTGQTGNILKTDGSVAAWGNINFDATVYVSKNGNDSTGDGSINKPFLTLTAAQNAITDNSPTKRYAIMVSPGTYTESGSFGIKRDVFIIGAGINATRIGATTITMNADFNQSGSPDDRSGFMNCGLLNNCDFNWLTVNSAAGKLYFTNVSFSGNLSVYGGTNAIAQAQMHSCLVFGSFTNSGINLGVGTNNIFFGSITMTQHPNGGMATICSFTGGAVSGAVTLNTTVSDFNRRCSLFARSFYMGGGLTINGPSSYADATADSLNGSPTVTNSGTLVNLNPNILANPTSSPILPVTTNATNFGDWGIQWAWSFAYVHASTGTDCYLISYPSAYGAASVGANVGIYADGAGLQANVNGGNIEIGTATASGNGVRGEIVLDGRQINVSNVKIVNLANATSNTDAVNLQQLNAVSSNSKVLTTTTTANLSSISDGINTTGKTTGLMLFNTTDNLIYVAGGGSNNSPWYPSNGGSAITPV